MPDRFYGCLKGESNPHQVTEGASTSSEAIELRVNDSVYADKQGVLNAIEAIKNYIITKEGSVIG